MDCGDEQAKHNGHAGGDASEWKKVAEMRSVVQAQDPSSKVLINFLPLPLHVHENSSND
jgi:hypothetical protein